MTGIGLLIALGFPPAFEHVKRLLSTHLGIFYHRAGHARVFILFSPRLKRWRNLIIEEQILHERSGASQVVTVSLGTGTIIPSHKDQLIPFIEEVDRRLYQAKQQGRNRIVEGS